MLLSLAKGRSYDNEDYIFKLTDKANNICETENKKTINPEHLYKALKVRLNFYLVAKSRCAQQVIKITRS